jgi:hypothetical protein
VPLALCLHAQLLTPRARRRPWQLDPAQLSAWTAAPVVPALVAMIIAATAPAVANPYTHSAHGTVADMGRAAGGAIGAVVAPDNTTPATAGVAPEDDKPPAGSFVQGAHGHSLPSTFTEAELHEADPQLQRLTAADRRLLRIFGNTIHLNDRTHLDGGISAAEDAKWQRLHNRVAVCSLPLYDLPNGCWPHRFLTTLTDLWVGVIQRRWNSEQPLVFQVVISAVSAGSLDSTMLNQLSGVGLMLGTQRATSRW